MSEACAAIAERLDPDLHRAAMFAPPGLRPRLMVLIAFDVELSRAGRASEKMIAAMRLQWWRDVVAEAFAGESRAHEVAGPLAALIQECNLP
ncbi:MAG: squalene/phytoene synthase family protein, partial [Pseudomonadota bacterium]